MMTDLSDPNTLPLAKSSQPLNRILGAQIDENGVSSYCLFPLSTLNNISGTSITKVTLEQAPLVPGENNAASLTFWSGTTTHYTVPLLLPPGRDGTNGSSSNEQPPSHTGPLSVPLQSGWNTPGHHNTGSFTEGCLDYANGLTASLGIGDTYQVGPTWVYLHLKPAKQDGAPFINPDLYLTFNQSGELGYTTENNGIPQHVFIASPADTEHDTAVTVSGVRNQQNRRDPLYLKDANGTYHGMTDNAISGKFGCDMSHNQKPLYTLFLSEDGTTLIYGAEDHNASQSEAFDPANPLLSWGAIPTAKGSLQGCAGLARKQWDARVAQDGDVMEIYNDIGPSGPFADDKIVIDAYPIDPGLVGRFQPPLCLPIANADGRCERFTFHGAGAAFYRFVATGRLA